VGQYFNKGSVLAKLETVPIQQRIERAELTKFNAKKNMKVNYWDLKKLIG